MNFFRHRQNYGRNLDFWASISLPLGFQEMSTTVTNSESIIGQQIRNTDNLMKKHFPPKISFPNVDIGTRQSWTRRVRINLYERIQGYKCWEGFFDINQIDSSMTKIAILALIGIILIASNAQFVPITQFVADKCNYDPSCLGNYPNTLNSEYTSLLIQAIRKNIIVNGKSVPLILNAYYDYEDPELTLLSCPGTMIPLGQDYKTCVLYEQGEAHDICRSAQTLECVNNETVVPPCCPPQ